MNLIKQLQTVTFHRVFVDIGGSINAALLLSNAIYWTHRLPPERDGWFYKTKPEWEKETGLSREQQDKARQQLIERGLLEVRRAKVSEDECVTALWFRVNVSTLQARLTSDDQTCETHSCQKRETHATKSAKGTIGLLIEKRTSTTTSITAPPPCAREREKFAMHENWQPSGGGNNGQLHEFRSYWIADGAIRTATAWEACFVRKLQNDKKHEENQRGLKHEQQQRIRASKGVSGQTSPRTRREGIAERCARYDDYAGDYSAQLDAAG